MFWVGLIIGLVVAGAVGFYGGLSYADRDPQLDEKIEAYVTKQIDSAVGAAGESLEHSLQELRDEIKEIKGKL